MHMLYALMLSAAPWNAPAPIDSCRDDGKELLDVYELVDPKDPTVNLRKGPGKEVLAAVPVGSKVVVTERADAEWLQIYAQPPPREVKGWLHQLDAETWFEGDAKPVAVNGLKTLYLGPSDTSGIASPVEGQVIVKKKVGDWLYVVWPQPADPIVAWVHKSRVKKVETRKPTAQCVSPPR